MNKVLPLDELYLRRKYPVMSLLQPEGGVLSGVARVIGDEVSPDFDMANSNLGNLTPVFPHVRGVDGNDASGESIGGAGADVDVEMAWLRAVMEGVERYANMAYAENEFIIASGNELGAAALDLDTVPQCSQKEYDDPKCPFVRADKSLPVRWVKGYSLVDRCERLVPAVMTHLYFRPSISERFWQMISTGVAAHVTLEAALNSAICEVIERDAIAISWLARLPLPRIELPTALPAVLEPNFQRLGRSLLRHDFFDATTDMGIPTVYAVQTLPEHPYLAQYVNCATEFDAALACAKTIREASPARTVFDDGPAHAGDVADFESLHEGAAYLGRPEHAHEFEFLLNTPNRRALNDIQCAAPADDKARLNYLVNLLKSKGMDIIAVDLTTRELREAGAWVVRVVIPGLMPMTSTYRGRFLAHPRLYEYPAAAGYGKLTEADINPAPQPFA